MKRFPLNDNLSAQDFQAYYWLKEELSAFCKTKGIDRSGGKLALSNRVLKFLASGCIVTSTDESKRRPVSKFDWNKEILTMETVITDNYKNSENVRSFFIRQIGPHFHFNVVFMKWAKHNIGNTLQEAIKEWNRLYELRKDKKHKTTIESQFEYNKYMRAFLADNPGKSSKDAMRYWKIKSSLRGTNEYEKSDLSLK